MSTADNIDLARREASLPGLSLVLDPNRVQDLLRSQQAIDPTDRVELIYIRYKPGRRALSLMQVVESTGGLRPLVVNACDAAGWNKLLSINRDDHLSSLQLDDSKCTIDWFPNDRRLRQAAKLFEPVKTAKILERVVGDRPREPWDLSMLAYKPHRRLVVKATSESRALALKCYTANDYSNAHNTILHVAQARIEGCSPCVLGSSERYSMIASAWIDGEVLSGDLTASSAWQNLFPNAGSLLARWHTEALRSLPMINHQHTAFSNNCLMRLAEDIVWLMPEIKDELLKLLSEIDGPLHAFACGRDVIHGDFYSKQIIVRGDSLHLIDFDEVGRGHCYQDLGTFVGKLYWNAVRTAADVSQLKPAIDAFVGGYEQQMGRLDWSLFQTSVVVGILRSMPHAFRRGLTDWRSKMRQMFEFAREWCPTASQPVGTVRFNAQSDDSETAPYLDTDWINQHWKKDATLAEPITDAHVVSAQLLRHKPGKRLLVEYSLQRVDGQTEQVIGKVRLKKRIDQRVMQLYKDLQILGSSGVRVPEFLGTLPHIHLWLQEKILGSEIQPISPLAIHRAVGQALAEMHCSKLEIERSHSIQDELAVLCQQFEHWLYPEAEYSRQSEGLLNSCFQAVDSLVPVENTIIHRDFYFDQVLSSRDGIALLDFDLATMGPPELDVGNYLAHLDEFAIRNSAEQQCSQAGEAFLEGYAENRPCLQHSNVNVWRYLSLARLVAISRRIPSRMHFTRALLELCRLHNPSRISGHEIQNAH